MSDVQLIYDRLQQLLDVYGTASNGKTLIYVGANSRFEYVNLSTAGQSGAYNDLTGKPTLGSAAALDAGSANGVATLDGSGKVPSAQIPSSIVDGLHFAGLWDASANTPTINSGSGTTGAIYKVSVAGTTTVDGINEWNAGDQIYFDGTVWDKIDGLSSEVLSVAGRVGNVVLSTADISGLSAVAGSGQYGDLLGLPSLFSGDFRDLTNSPPLTPLGSIWNHDAQQGASFGSIEETLTSGPTWQYLTSIQVNDVDAFGNNVGAQNSAIQIGDRIYVWYSATSYAIGQVTAITAGNFGPHSTVYTLGAGLLFWTGSPPASGVGQLRFGFAYRPDPDLSAYVLAASAVFTGGINAGNNEILNVGNLRTVSIGGADGAAAFAFGNTGILYLNGSYGSAGQVLAGQGNAGPPVWVTPPSALSQFSNDVGYITASALSVYAVIADLSSGTYPIPYSCLTGAPDLSPYAVIVDLASGSYAVPYSCLTGTPTGLTEAFTVLAGDGVTVLTLSFSTGLLQSVT